MFGSRMPHVVNRRLIRDIQIPLQRLVNDARARATAAVVEIDDRPIEREGLLDLAPVGFIRRDAGRRLRGDSLARRLHAEKPGIGECRSGGCACHAGRPQELPTAQRR